MEIQYTELLKNKLLTEHNQKIKNWLSEFLVEYGDYVSKLFKKTVRADGLDDKNYSFGFM